MKLTDLDPHWVGHGGEGVTDRDGNAIPYRERIGVSFDCPCGCGSPLFVGFANPPDGGPMIYPERASWKREGDTFETLTLTPSILRSTNRGGCGWHGFVTDGEIRTC